eukprot:609337-Pelagomonas_calceolata.AAC.1
MPQLWEGRQLQSVKIVPPGVHQKMCSADYHATVGFFWQCAITCWQFLEGAQWVCGVQNECPKHKAE